MATPEQASASSNGEATATSALSEKDGDDERTKKALTCEGNHRCADCWAQCPSWVETHRGIAICRSCATEHHMLGSDISRVKCVGQGETLKDSVILILESKGNDGSNAHMEAILPEAYRRPLPNEFTFYRKHFITAKYVRNEFSSTEQSGLRRSSAIPQPYITGEINYTLMKKGRDKDVYLPRSLEVSAVSGKLRYSDKDTGERGCVPLTMLNVVIVTEKDLDGEGDNLVLVVTYPEDTKKRKPCEVEEKGSDIATRSLFFKGYPFLEGRDIVEWYVAIRHARLMFPEKTCLTPCYDKMGWLHKKKRVKDPFLKRWFVVDGNRVRYSENPMDPVPKGEFELSMGPGYGVFEGIEGDDETAFAFTILTPGREYYLHAKSGTYKSWLEVFGALCIVPPSLNTLV